MLRLHTFGGCFLAREGARLDGFSGQRKALALLAVLAAAGERGAGREALLATLWPESDQERARLSLNQLVHSLRQQLGLPDLLLTMGDIRLNPAHIATDIADFRAALQRGHDEVAVGLYTGPFLDGFYLRGAGSFEQWAATTRAELANGAARALEAAAERASVQGDASAAVALWRRLVQEDPLSARAATGLMVALDAAGEPAAALRHARVYELLVREEVDAEPDASVTDLVARLQQRRDPSPAPLPSVDVHQESASAAGESAPVPHAVDDPLPAVGAPRTVADGSDHATRRTERAPLRRTILVTTAAALVLAMLFGYGAWVRRTALPVAQPDPAHSVVQPDAPPSSVAVLPFVNTSGDLADEHFSDGLTDELIAALGRVPGLKVSSRTSAFALKGKGLGVREVADTLHVATILEGSVRRADGRLRVTAQLVAAPDGRVLWAEAYHRPSADVFAVQEEIARAIVGALRVRLAGDARDMLVHPGTSDVAAYEQYLRGQLFFNQRTPSSLRRAVAFFEQAIAQDPAFARAYAALANTHLALIVFGNARPTEELPRARVAVLRALALDSMVAEAHGALGHLRFTFDWEWTDGRRAVERAIALDAGYAFARQLRGIYLMNQGRLDESVTALRGALAVDPLSAAIRMNLGQAYVYAHQPDTAMRHLRNALELNPALALAHQHLGFAYLQKRMPTEAVAAFAHAAARGSASDSALLAYAYGITGQRREAEGILRNLVAQEHDQYLQPSGMALAYVGLGDHDAAFRRLEQGYREHAAYMNQLKVHPAYEPLHADPRWQALLRRLRLSP